MKLIYSIHGIGRHSPDPSEVSLSTYWGTNIYSFSSSRDEINDIITKEYNILMKDIPKDDVVMQREKLKHVYKWHEASSIVPSNKSAESIAAKLINAKVQFSGLVST